MNNVMTITYLKTTGVTHLAKSNQDGLYLHIPQEQQSWPSLAEMGSPQPQNNVTT